MLVCGGGPDVHMVEYVRSRTIYIVLILVVLMDL